MKLIPILLFMLVTVAALGLLVPDADAFKFYSDDSGAVGDGTQNCAGCHGEFRSGTYMPPSGAPAWAGTLHQGHLDNTTIGGNCDNCHGGVDTIQRGVNLSSSGTGPGGVMALACVGCHGRQADTVGNPNALGDGWGAGLRQHHNANGVGLCAGCHADANPANFTPAGEDAMPMYYPQVTNNVTVPPTLLEPCNLNGEENFESDPSGLDNDGDNVYDGADPDCQAPVENCDVPGDEDGNGLADCLDPVCDGQTGPNGETCEFGMEMTCDDGSDNDGDGLIDCLDPDCDGQPGPGGGICELGTELSCFDAFDNDADGAIDCADVDCDGQTAGLNTCNTGLSGICAEGSRTCMGGMEMCAQDNQAVEESIAAGNCNDGLDNDCDGLTDLQDPECQGAEDCFNGIDDNGDGLIDCEEPSCFGVVDGACNTGEPGECAPGLLTCSSDGTDTKMCMPVNQPQPELCDGLDNDCDGVIDNGFPDLGMMCTVGLGECAVDGVYVCTADGLGTECDAVPGTPQAELCDGLDNDCDGTIDNGFPDLGMMCTVGVGACENTGAYVCSADGLGTECDVLPLPPGVEGPEGNMNCMDMIDNDCDGLTDGDDPDCGAAVMPPPVRQNIGFPDSSIADLTEEECRFCHEDPNIVDDANIPNRHHNLVGTPVADPTVRPFPDGDTNGNYDCYSCHALVWDGTAFVLETFRDCIFCHNTGSPHHTTEAAQAQLCDDCHGPVNNPFDGHQIPTTTPSLVTPEPSGGDGVPLNSRGNGAGACDYCHDSGLEPESGIVADTNRNLHHNTGLFDNPGDCSWCHKNGNPFSTDADRIRTCERCHGFELLHNIQADSNGDGQIIPNGEDPYWGHIGSNDDCWGCHGFASAAAPGTGPIIPHVEMLSQYSVSTGADTTITLTGVALTNTVGTDVMDSQVVLTASDGSTTTLATTAISESSMDVVVPASLAAGNYKLRAVKGSNDSNAVGLTVIPAVTITGTDCDKKNGMLTITGSGFGTKPEGTDADIYVLVNDQPVEIISWSDTEIRVSVSSCPKRPTVTVNALFGSATSSDNGGGGKPDKPCRGKKC